ncbi:uncharacterized protein LOC114298034 [Camellia sinensis]|uniref:uncharacterized protein LOC114298034 n=1 Tax=Camellia sinensis TaxID=4442 RepID=UPI001036C6DB|nr:uncharacterized protein LOC114298034 [Camellia sinensis]
MDVEAMDVEENPLRKRRRNVLCVEKKARIKFTEKSFEPEEGEEEEKVKQGYTSLCGFEDDRFDKVPISISEEEIEEEALRLKRMRLLTHSAFLRIYFLKKLNRQRCISITERIPRPFRKWVKYRLLKRWVFDSSGMKVVGFSDDVCSVFKQIGGGLKELLYRREFHGSLPTGVMVSRSQMVKFVNLTSFASPPSQVDFESGLKKDIEDFKQLVLKIKLPRNSTTPIVLTLFCRLCDNAQLTTGVELVDLAFFIYSNALFHDDNDRCYFFISVWDFIKANLHKGLSILRFDKGVVNMRGWRSSLRDPRFSALKRASRRKGQSYHKAFGIVKFHRNFMVHVDSYLKIPALRRLTYATKLLREAFSDFPAKFFYLVATLIRRRQAKFGPDGLVSHIRRTVTSCSTFS